jgi:hypothetical protein
MASQNDDSAFDNATSFASRLNKEMEKERARYQKDLQDFERTVHQTRAKYQGQSIDFGMKRTVQMLTCRLNS